MIRYAFLVTVMLAAVQPAFGQINSLVADDPRTNARLKLGPFYVRPAIGLSDVGIDTNVFNQADEAEADLTATLTPSATVWVPIARRGLLKAVIAPDLVWYKEFASERSLNPAMTLRGEGYLRRFTVFAENEFLRSRQRPNFEIDLRSRRVENRVTAGVDVRVLPKLSFELNGTRSTTEFDADAEFLGTSLEETLNRRSIGFGTVTRYRPTVLTSILLTADRTEERFPLSPERGADNVRVAAGVEFSPRALITGKAALGVRHLNPLDESRLPEFSGLVSDLELQYTLLGATTAGVTFVRDVRYSFEPLQPYFVDNGVGLRVRRALGGRFDIVATGNRNTYAYRDLLVQGHAAERQRVDTTVSYGASVGYRLGREGRVGIGAAYWQRSSTTEKARDYDGLRVGTTFTYGF